MHVIDDRLNPKSALVSLITVVLLYELHNAGENATNVAGEGLSLSLSLSLCVCACVCTHVVYVCVQVYVTGGRQVCKILRHEVQIRLKISVRKCLFWATKKSTPHGRPKPTRPVRFQSAD